MKPLRPMSITHARTPPNPRRSVRAAQGGHDPGSQSACRLRGQRPGCCAREGSTLDVEPGSPFTGGARVDPGWNANHDTTATGVHAMLRAGRALGLAHASEEAVPPVERWHGALATTALAHLTVSGTIDEMNGESNR